MNVFRQWSFSIVALMLVVFVSACGRGDEDAMLVQKAKFRCDQPGLCLYPVGKKSLQGAYRVGDDELKFDVLYRPFHGFSVGEVYPWCMRLVDHKNQEFSSHFNEHCPLSWHKQEGIQEFMGEDSFAAYAVRDKMVVEVQPLLIEASAPSNRETALDQIRDMIDTHVNYLKDPNALSPLVMRHKRKQLVRPSLQQSALVDGCDTWDDAAEDDVREARSVSEWRDRHSDIADVDDPLLQEQRSFVLEPARDDEYPDEDAWPIISGDDEKSTVVQSPLHASQALSRENGALSLFSAGAGDGVPKKSPEEVIEDPAFEYKQHIDLYSKSVKRHLLGGPATWMHHTAAYIQVFARRRHSSGEWRRIAQAFTANHGSSPLSSEMKAYDWCRDTPVT